MGSQGSKEGSCRQGAWSGSLCPSRPQTKCCLTPPAPVRMQGEQHNSSPHLAHRAAFMLCHGRPLISICLDLLSNPMKEIVSIPILQLGKLSLSEIKFQDHRVSTWQRNPSPVLPACPHHPPSACTHTYAPARTLVGPPSLPTGRAPTHWHHTLPSTSSRSNSSQSLPSPVSLRSR